MRYEYNAPPYDADNQMRILNLETLQLQQVGSNGVSRSGLDGDRNNIAPRVGMSWDVDRRWRDGRSAAATGFSTTAAR